MPDEEIVVKPNAVEDVKGNSQENEQMAQLKKQAHEAIDQADGILIFAFKKTEVDLQNGQKAVIPKSMFQGVGCSGGGDINLAYIVERSKELLKSQNDQYNAQQAAISA